MPSETALKLARNVRAICRDATARCQDIKRHDRREASEVEDIASDLLLLLPVEDIAALIVEIANIR